MKKLGIKMDFHFLRFGLVGGDAMNLPPPPPRELVWHDPEWSQKVQLDVKQVVLTIQKV